MIICKTPTCEDANMFVSQVILSEITLKLRVNQLVKTTVALADRTMMMQLCRHNWEVKNLQQCTSLLATPTIPYPAGQHIVQLLLRRITCAADVIAICEYEGSASSCAKQWEHLRHSPVYGRSRPKHAMSEGFMTLANDKRLEANRLIELRLHELTHHACWEYEAGVALSSLA